MMSNTVSTTMEEQKEDDEEALRRSLTTKALSSDLSKPLTAVLTQTNKATTTALQTARARHPPPIITHNNNNNNTSTNSLPSLSEHSSCNTSTTTTARLRRQRQPHHPPRNSSSLVPRVAAAPSARTCRIGILLHSTALHDDAATAVMDHGISFCQLTALCVLHPTPSPSDSNDDDDDDDGEVQEEQDEAPNDEKKTKTTTAGQTKETACREWLHAATNYPSPDSLPLFFGQDGLTAMLTDDPHLVDAVYLLVPTEDHQSAVLTCLRASKHVLMKDFRSTALPDFQKQVAQAQAVQRFIQFSTMFDIQYNVQAFLDTVLQVPTFGRIERITAELEIGPNDLTRVGAQQPLAAGDSCINRLARYCILMGLLMTPAELSRPLRAQIEWCLRLDPEDPSSVPIAAKGQVWFDNGRLLQLQVSYSAVRTHQRLQVHAATKYAVLGHFCLPAEHGLHSFRVYDCNYVTDKQTGKLQADVTAGEALDVSGGLPQHVMMWRGFAGLCQAVQDKGWESATQATFLTHAAVALKATLKALETSAAEKNRVVDVVLE